MSVLVFIENKGNILKKSDMELASYGAALADMLNTEAVAFAAGFADNPELKRLGDCGIAKVLVDKSEKFSVPCGSVFSKAISDVAESINADVVVMSAGNLSKSVAPRVAVRMKAGFISNVQGLPKRMSPLEASKRIFNGKIFSEQRVGAGRIVMTLAPNSFGMTEKPKEITVSEINTEISQSTVSVIDTARSGGKIQLGDADVVVSGGRGMRSADNWSGLEELAGLLGAALACSRPVSDDGWRPHNEHVGQTGKIISPNLYMAFGISGATQHMGGVSASKCIVAVNRDAQAPVFEYADYGIVGDVDKVIPQLIDFLKSNN